MSAFKKDIDAIGSDFAADVDAVGSDGMRDISKRIDDIGSRIDKVLAVPKKPAKDGADTPPTELPISETPMTYCTHLPTSD